MRRNPFVTSRKLTSSSAVFSSLISSSRKCSSSTGENDNDNNKDATSPATNNNSSSSSQQAEAPVAPTTATKPPAAKKPAPPPPPPPPGKKKVVVAPPPPAPPAKKKVAPPPPPPASAPPRPPAPVSPPTATAQKTTSENVVIDDDKPEAKNDEKKDSSSVEKQQQQQQQEELKKREEELAAQQKAKEDEERAQQLRLEKEQQKADPEEKQKTEEAEKQKKAQEEEQEKVLKEETEKREKDAALEEQQQTQKQKEQEESLQQQQQQEQSEQPAVKEQSKETTSEPVVAETVSENATETKQQQQQEEKIEIKEKEAATKEQQLEEKVAVKQVEEENANETTKTEVKKEEKEEVVNKIDEEEIPEVASSEKQEEPQQQQQQQEQEQKQESKLKDFDPDSFGKYRQQLCDLYQEYGDSRGISKVDEILTKNIGKEEELIAKIQGEFDKKVDACKQELETIYKQHAPERIPKIDSTLKKYRAKLDYLMTEARKKYLSSPPPPSSASFTPQPQQQQGNPNNNNNTKPWRNQQQQHHNNNRPPPPPPPPRMTATTKKGPPAPPGAAKPPPPPPPPKSKTASAATEKENTNEEKIPIFGTPETKVDNMRKEPSAAASSQQQQQSSKKSTEDESAVAMNEAAFAEMEELFYVSEKKSQSYPLKKESTGNTKQTDMKSAEDDSHQQQQTTLKAVPFAYQQNAPSADLLDTNEIDFSSVTQELDETAGILGGLHQKKSKLEREKEERERRERAELQAELNKLDDIGNEELPEAVLRSTNRRSSPEKIITTEGEVIEDSSSSNNNNDNSSSNMMGSRLSDAVNVNKDAASSLETEMDQFVKQQGISSSNNKNQQQTDTANQMMDDIDEDAMLLFSGSGRSLRKMKKKSHQHHSSSSTEKSQQQSSASSQHQQSSSSSSSPHSSFYSTLAQCTTPVKPKFVGPLVEFVRDEFGRSLSACFLREARDVSELAAAIKEIVEFANDGAAPTPTTNTENTNSSNEEAADEDGSKEEAAERARESLISEPFPILTSSSLTTFAPVWTTEMSLGTKNRSILFELRDETLRSVVNSRRPLIASLDRPADGFGAELALCCRNFICENSGVKLSLSELRSGVLPAPATVRAFSSLRTDEVGLARNVSLDLESGSLVLTTKSSSASSSSILDGLFSNIRGGDSSSSNSSSIFASVKDFFGNIAQGKFDMMTMMNKNSSSTSSSASRHSSSSSVKFLILPKKEVKTFRFDNDAYNNEDPEDYDNTDASSSISTTSANKKRVSLLKSEEATSEVLVKYFEQVQKEQLEKKMKSINSPSVKQIVKECNDVTEATRHNRRRCEMVLTNCTHHTQETPEQIEYHRSLNSNNNKNELQLEQEEDQQNQQHHRNGRVTTLTNQQQDLLIVANNVTAMQLPAIDSLAENELNNIEVLLCCRGSTNRNNSYKKSNQQQEDDFVSETLTELVTSSELFTGASVQRGKMKSSPSNTQPPVTVITTNGPIDRSIKHTWSSLDQLVAVAPPQRTVFGVSCPVLCPQTTFVEIVSSHPSTSEGAVSSAMSVFENDLRTPCIHTKADSLGRSVMERLCVSYLKVYAELCSRRDPSEIQQVLLNKYHFQVTPLEIWESLGAETVGAMMRSDGEMKRKNNSNQNEQEEQEEQDSSSSVITSSSLFKSETALDRAVTSMKMNHVFFGEAPKKLMPDRTFVPPSVERALRWTPTDEEIVDALAGALVKELCIGMDEGRIADSVAADALSLAVGFPLKTGGAMQYSSSQGLQEFSIKMEKLNLLLGEKCLQVPNRLREAASNEEEKSNSNNGNNNNSSSNSEW